MKVIKREKIEEVVRKVLKESLPREARVQKTAPAASIDGYSIQLSSHSDGTTVYIQADYDNQMYVDLQSWDKIVKWVNKARMK